VCYSVHFVRYRGNPVIMRKKTLGIMFFPSLTWYKLHVWQKQGFWPAETQHCSRSSDEAQNTHSKH